VRAIDHQSPHYALFLSLSLSLFVVMKYIYIWGFILVMLISFSLHPKLSKIHKPIT
jgi:hypothetical protein